jgi:hypothetical protein
MVPGAISYELLDNGHGRLTASMVFHTPITGYTALDGHAFLTPDGVLSADIGYEWDFASGPAIDTPAMVRASIAHDIFCSMTNKRLIPWECRAKSDRYFADLLKHYKVGKVRRLYSWMAVSAYSQLIAKWKDKQ